MRNERESNVGRFSFFLFFSLSNNLQSRGRCLCFYKKVMEDKKGIRALSFATRVGDYCYFRL